MCEISLVSSPSISALQDTDGESKGNGERRLSKGPEAWGDMVDEATIVYADLKTYVVEVTVFEGRNIPKLDGNVLMPLKSDPYVIARVFDGEISRDRHYVEERTSALTDKVN